MLTYHRIAEIIQNRTWHEFIGETEGASLDGKSQPYRLDGNDKEKIESEKLELAKDVVSFANAAGGFIVIGLKTKPSTTHFSDEIIDLRPFERQLFNHDQYNKIIGEWVYPNVEGVTVSWEPDPNRSGKGFGVIHVPTQPSEKRPFLLSKTVIGNRRSEVLFGYVERQRDVNEPKSIAELHQAIRDGLVYKDTIQDGFQALKRLILERTTPDVIAKKKVDPLEGVETILRAEPEILQQRYLALVGFPTFALSLDNFFSPDLKVILEDPPIVGTRTSGFYVGRGKAQLVEGRIWRVAGLWNIVDLNREGCLSCVIGDRFLTYQTTGVELNTLAVVESIYTFCLLYQMILRKIMQDEQTLSIYMRMDNLNKKETILVPYALGSTGWIFDRSLGQDTLGKPQVNRLDRTIEIGSLSDFDPPRIAFRLLSEVFGVFGFSSERIPYSTELPGGIRIISAQEIGKVSG